MPPPLTRGGDQSSISRIFYAKRVAARSARVPLTANVPFRVGLADRPSRDDKFNFKQDVLGPLIAQHYPVVPDGSRQNLLAAFDKRCNYYSDARADPSIVKASCELLDRFCPTAWDPIEWTPELFHAWNAQFKPDKQARHLKVFPLIAECTVKDFSNKQIFTKVEALLKRHDKNWAPRVIYQSTDLHNAILGPIMQKCTKRLFYAIEHDNPTDDMCFMGAYKHTSDELCSRINRHGSEQSVYVESDFSSNDMTQVRDVHILETKWLRRLGAPLWLTSLMLHANSFTVASRRHGVMVRIKNQLPTGAQSTTFRNSMWNMTICYAFCKRVKAKGDTLILGDDMLMRYDNPISKRVKNVRREYEHVCKLACMDAKVATKKHLSECEFLSKQFIMTDHGFVLAPKLGKAIARFNARASSNEAVSDAAYLAGKALSYAYEFRFVPALARCFLLRYRQLCPPEGVSFDGLGWNAKGAFLDLGVDGVLKAINEAQHPAMRADMTRFYHWKYSLTAQDVIELAMATLFGEEDLDVAGVGYICADFL